MSEGVRRAWRTTYRLTDPRRGEGSSDVDIARGAHGVDGVRHTASVPCRVAAAGVMGDKGEQRGGGVEWPDLLQGEVCVRGRQGEHGDEVNTATRARQRAGGATAVPGAKLM